MIDLLDVLGGWMSAEEYVIRLIGNKCHGMKIEEEEVDKDTPLENFPLGSLRILEIINEIESDYGMDVDESKLFNISTVGDLINLVPDR